jgi:type I restriction enzyme S subunit
VIEWKEFALEEVVEKFIDYRGKTPKKTASGVPLITAKIVKNGRINTPNEFIALEDYDKWMTRGIPQKGDVVMTTEAPLGEVAQLCFDGKVALAQRIITMRGKVNVLDNGFLKYMLQSPLMQHRIHSRSSGTTVIGIKSSELKNIPIPVPPIDIQKKIASILGSIDEKIELNLKMNKTLEEMAMTLYKHWFVDFGPFQDGEFEESELGMIPKGWTIHKYSDLLDSYIGGDWGKDEPNEIENVEVGVIRGADFDKLSNGEFGNIPKRFIKTNSFDKRRMMERDIIIENSVNSSTRCVGKSFIVTKELINILGTNLICASFCKLFRLKEKKFASLAYLHLNYLYDTGKMEDYQNVSSNGIGNFQAKEFVKMEGIPMPNDFKQIKDIIDTFNNIIDQISLNRSEVFQLSSLRDYLLPRLLSGEIDLSKAEKQVEKVL